MRLQMIASSLLLLFAPAFSLAATAADADDFDTFDRTPAETILLKRWPVSAGSDESKQVTIGTIRYSVSAKTGRYEKAVVPEDVANDEREYYRVGIVKGGGWVGGVVRGSDLQASLIPEVALRVDGKGEVWNVNYDAIRSPKASYSSASEPTVTVVTTEAGTIPHLNKPVVLTAEGKLPEKPEEKTFLQKYWYLILGAMVLLLAGGGDAK